MIHNTKANDNVNRGSRSNSTLNEAPLGQRNNYNFVSALEDIINDNIRMEVTSISSELSAEHSLSSVPIKFDRFIDNKGSRGNQSSVTTKWDLYSKSWYKIEFEYTCDIGSHDILEDLAKNIKNHYSLFSDYFKDPCYIGIRASDNLKNTTPLISGVQDKFYLATELEYTDDGETVSGWELVTLKDKCFNTLEEAVAFVHECNPDELGDKFLTQCGQEDPHYVDSDYEGDQFLTKEQEKRYAGWFYSESESLSVITIERQDSSGKNYPIMDIDLYRDTYRIDGENEQDCLREGYIDLVVLYIDDPNLVTDTPHTHDISKDTIKESRILKECKELDCKMVYDVDGFTTDYTLYYDPKNDEYFTIFGDKDLYDGNPDEADMTFASEEEAREWFDNYEGFVENCDLSRINEAASRRGKIIDDDLETAIRSLLQEKIDEDIVTIHTTMYKDASWSLKLVDTGLYKIKYELDIDFGNYPIKKDPSFRSYRINTLVQWDLEDIADDFDAALRESDLGVCLTKKTLDKHIYGDIGVNKYLGEASIVFVVGGDVGTNKKVETSTEPTDQSAQITEDEGDAKVSFDQVTLTDESLQVQLEKADLGNIYDEHESYRADHIKEFQNITFPKDKDTSLKNWYKAEFPTDELGDKIPATTTFKTIFDLLQKHKDVYPHLAGDSLVRERVFDELCNILGCDYDDIYYTWLETGKPTSGKQHNTKTLGNAPKDQVAKMDAWHSGERKENIKACSDDKIKEFLTICKEKGYDKEANILRAELEKRGALEGSLLEDAEVLDTTDIEDTLSTIIKRVFGRKYPLYVYNLDIDRVAEKNDQLEITLLNSITWDDEGGLEDDYQLRIMGELEDDLSNIEEDIRLSSLNKTFDVENISHKTDIDVTSNLEDFAEDKYTYNAEITVTLILPLRDNVKFL